MDSAATCRECGASFTSRRATRNSVRRHVGRYSTTGVCFAEANCTTSSWRGVSIAQTQKPRARKACSAEWRRHSKPKTIANEMAGSLGMVSLGCAKETPTWAQPSSAPTSPGAAPAMSGARQLAVYDGTRHIGTVIERDDRTCIARDVNGRKLGVFPNVQKAADAITAVDAVFSGAKSKKSA